MPSNLDQSVDEKKYGKNYDAIDWSDTEPVEPIEDEKLRKANEVLARWKRER